MWYALVFVVGGTLGMLGMAMFVAAAQADRVMEEEDRLAAIREQGF